MSWVKIDDRANEHHKQLAAGPAACWLWACGLMYCNRQQYRTGLIPAVAIPVLFPGANKKLAAKLVEVGLWEITEDGYRIHDYFFFQPSNEDVEDRKRSRSEAGRLGGLRSGEARREAKPKQLASTLLDVCLKQDEAKANPVPVPVPVPVPKEESSARKRATPKTRIPDSGDEYLTFAVKWGFEAISGSDFEKFISYNRAHGNAFSDWSQAWRNWQLKTKDYARPGGGYAPIKQAYVAPTDEELQRQREFRESGGFE